MGWGLVLAGAWGVGGCGGLVLARGRVGGWSLVVRRGLGACLGWWSWDDHSHLPYRLTYNNAMHSIVNICSGQMYQLLLLFFFLSLTASLALPWPYAAIRLYHFESSSSHMCTAITLLCLAESIATQLQLAVTKWLPLTERNHLKTSGI